MSLNILIVEDMPETQDWLKQAVLLALPSANISVASDLQAAAQIINQVQVELALVDLKLPDGTGETVIASLKQLQPDCISIVVTLFADEHHLQSSMNAGANGYILKDQSREKIAVLVSEVVMSKLQI